MSLRLLKKRLWRNDMISFVYFIGRSPTQKRQLSFRKLFLGVVVSSALVLIGTLGTAITLVVFAMKSDEEKQLLKRQAALLDYQVRYENVFERAYQLITSSPAIAAEKNEPSENIMGPIELENFEETVSSEAATVLDLKPMPEPIYSSDLFLKEVRMLARGDRTIVNFLLQNASDDLKTGFAYAVATYQMPDGSREYLSAPDPDIVFRKDGSLLDHNLGQVYRMKRKKYFEFDFVNPENQAGKIAYITVYVSNNLGQVKLRYSSQPLFIKLIDSPKTELAH